MQVILIAGNYPPDPAIGAVRAGAVSAYLTRQGHSVRTITRAGRFAPPAEGIHAAIRTPWVRLPTFRMMRSGVAPSESAEPSSPAPPVQGSRALRRHISKIAHAMASIPDPQGGWIPFAYSAGHRELTRFPADIIVATGPTFSAHIVASLLSRRFRVPWVADYRDLWTSSTYYPYGRLRHAIDTLLERQTVGSANLVITVSSVLAEDLRREMGIPVQVVRNGYDDVDLPSVSEREPLSEARVNLLYVGNSFYDGRRTPQPLFRAARELAAQPRDLRFHFLGADPGFVMPLAKAEGIEGLVECHPSVDRSESLSMQSRADALLLLLWNNPGERGTVTGKLFEYVAARRPILLLGYGQGEAARLVSENSLGWIADDDNRTMAALRGLLSMKSSSELLPDLSDHSRKGLSRDEQCRLLPELLHQTVQRDTDGALGSGRS